MAANDQDSQETSFHGSVDLLIRINNVLQKINDCKENHDGRSWLTYLKTYYTELYPLLKEEEVERVAGLMKAANEKVNKLQPQQKIEGAYSELWELELELRKLHHNHGLYTKLVDREDLGSTLLT